jgi:cell division protein FtsB
VIIALIMLLMVIPILYEVTTDKAKINRNRESFNATSEEIRAINLENEQLKRYADGENFDEYLERYARDEWGYADPQERVFRVQ